MSGHMKCSTSYNGATYRRNRTHLKPTCEPPGVHVDSQDLLEEENLSKQANELQLIPDLPDDEVDLPVVQTNEQNKTPNRPSPDSGTRTRSGRVTKPPAYTKDYV